MPSSEMEPKVVGGENPNDDYDSFHACALTSAMSSREEAGASLLLSDLLDRVVMRQLARMKTAAHQRAETHAR